MDELKGNGETILVIDDESDICNLATEILNKFNYNAVGKILFSEAVEYFKENFENIKLILMDYTIPGESAEKTVETFRAISPNIPIIIMSGYLINSNVENNITTLNVDEAIQKPFDMTSLMKKIKSVL